MLDEGQSHIKTGEAGINVVALVGFSKMKLHEGFPLKLLLKSILNNLISVGHAGLGFPATPYSKQLQLLCLYHSYCCPVESSIMQLLFFVLLHVLLMLPGQIISDHHVAL